MKPLPMKNDLCAYIVRGQCPSDFLMALLCDRLRATYAYADHINAERVKDYVQFLYDNAPSACWGSQENVDRWIEGGGMVGFGVDPRRIEALLGE